MHLVNNSFIRLTQHAFLDDDVAIHRKLYRVEKYLRRGFRFGTP